MKRMKGIFISILTPLIFSLGYNHSTAQDLPSVNIQNELFYSHYCIYHLEETNKTRVDEIEALISEVLPTYQLVDSLSGDPTKHEYILVWFSDPKSEYPAPDMAYLKYSGHGLSSNEASMLQSPRSAVLLYFTGKNENAINDQIRINQLISSILKGKSSIVTDYITYESFNSDSWDENRVSNFSEENLDITSQFTIHFYRENGFCRAVTLGLEKFSLPDISLQNLSCKDQLSYGSLINLVGQTWIEQPLIREDTTLLLDITKLKNDSVRTRLLKTLEQNASKKSLISLASVAPQEGDAYNRQFEIVFNDASFSSEQEQQQVVITELFGATDQISYIEHTDRILQASQEAKQKLPELKTMFNKGLDPGYSILLKAPFETDDGGNEWMWVEVTEWKKGDIKGILQNDPFEIANLSAGAIVSIDPEEVFDYILYLPDGTFEGNETGKIMSEGN